MTAMNEEEFWRAVFCILGRLLLADFAQIPNVQTTIGAARRENRLVVRRPLNLEDLVFVRLKAVQFELQVAQIPQSDRLKASKCAKRKSRDSSHTNLVG